MTESTAYNAWLYDNLNPDEQLMYHRYPARHKSTLADIMETPIEYRPPVDEEEQTRLEDLYLSKFGL